MRLAVLNLLGLELRRVGPEDESVRPRLIRKSCFPVAAVAQLKHKSALQHLLLQNGTSTKVGENQLAGESD